MIDAIKIDQEKIKQFKFDKTNGFLFEISQLNVFVGVNNSGKSRLLRVLSAQDDGVEFFKNNIDEKDSRTLKDYLKSSFNAAKNYASQYGFILKDDFDYEKKITLIPLSNPAKCLEYADKCTFFNRNSFEPFPKKIEPRLVKVLEEFKGVQNRVLGQYRRFLLNKQTKRLYIPILRGLRPIQSVGDNKFSNEDTFLRRTKFDYFKNRVNNLSFYSGLTIYEDVMKLLLGTEEQRAEIREFESFLEEYLFKSKVTLIPKYDEDVLHIKLGNQRQYEIYNLGDGLQTIISILFPVFVRRKEAHLVFIEEPENHLHPAWQTLLLRALKTFEQHTFFFTTHSATFINDESTAVFLINKKAASSIVSPTLLENQKVDIINQLGYKPSDLFQTNYILWVEGPSDKIYFDYWISTIDASLKEGLHYSIMFFGGETYKSFLMNEGKFELSFVRKLNQNFGIVLDSDRKKNGERYNPKKKEIIELFQKGGNFCWLTKYREIENYIPKTNFENSVEKYHKKETEIVGDPFEDRCTPVDKGAKTSYRSTIKIPQQIFTKIQKNGDGSTKGIAASLLRREIEKAIQNTSKNTFNINKVKVAQEIVKSKPQVEILELNQNLQKLVNRIKAANHM